MTAGYADYEKSVHQSLWAWAERHHRGELDGGRRQHRPPVLAVGQAPKNILVPVNEARAQRIRDAAPKSQWHRWFRSLKSSQALTCSVFGAVQAFGRLDLLEDVDAECGRLAFADDLRAARLKFEYEVRSLGEPRPTSVDVLLCGGQERVAVECKFTERAFGVCSRPALHRGDTNYCDGSYRVQHGRGTRCALTEQGIRYWQYLPGLFDWPANRDHNPCPFGAVYQLARNGLAASVDLDRAADCPAAHALVVYDTRNPEFSGNGKAARQWAAAIGACRQPGLLRRVTWQHLIVALARAPEMGYLVEALEAKYGLRPS